MALLSQDRRNWLSTVRMSLRLRFCKDVSESEILDALNEDFSGCFSVPWIPKRLNYDLYDGCIAVANCSRRNSLRVSIATL
jgi:hypothetical protein